MHNNQYQQTSNELITGASGAYYSSMDLYSNDVSHTSSEERTASVSSLYSNNNRNNNGNNRQPDSDPLAVKLKQIADIESRYKQLPQKRKPENVLRAKRFLK